MSGCKTFAGSVSAMSMMKFSGFADVLAPALRRSAISRNTATRTSSKVAFPTYSLCKGTESYMYRASADACISINRVLHQAIS